MIMTFSVKNQTQKRIIQIYIGISPTVLSIRSRRQIQTDQRTNGHENRRLTVRTPEVTLS